MSETKKTEMKMEQVAALWLRKSKAGKMFLTGSTAEKESLVGFINGKKNNPKEPDIRLYKLDAEGKAQKDEWLSVWSNVSKNDKKYLSGKLDGVRIVGFINKQNGVDSKRPYITLYKSDQEPQKKEPTVDADGFMKMPEGEELPF